MKETVRLFDYHTHALEHGVAKTLRVEEMIQTALASDLSAICLTDHLPLPTDFVDPTPDKDCAMTATDYVAYQREITEARERYNKEITVLRGVEVDFLPEYQGWTAEKLEAYPYDYALGSVHFLGIPDGRNNILLDFDAAGFDQAVELFGGARNLVEAYYARVQQMAKSGLFDAVGHIDLVKKYNDGRYFSDEEAWYKSAVGKTLDGIQIAGMAIELNTSGWDKPCNEQYPSLWILKQARTKDIPLTLSSDAHVPEKVGDNFDRAIAVAKTAGYTSLVCFKKRQKRKVTL